MKRRFLVIPFLLILASLLQLNYIASQVVSPDQIVRPLVVLWLLVALLIWPAYQLTRDWNWSALLLAVLVLGFAFSGDFFSLVLASIGLIGIFWLALVRLKRSRLQLNHFMYILMGASVLFTAYGFYLQGSMLSRIPWARYQQSISEAEKYTLPSLSSSSVRRDIYYIVVDGYARSDVLRDLFGFDNSEFTGYLQEKGFILPESVHSNYPATPLSIASTLNMEYVQALVPSLDQSPHRWLMAPLIDHSRTRSLLESRGYSTISISTNWTITDNVTTDRYLQPMPVMLTDFESFILDMTPLKLLESLIRGSASVPTSESHQKIIQFNFTSLADLPKSPGPKFVFVHIISPHAPFVFGSEGKPLESSHLFTFQDADEFPGTTEEYLQRYVDQVQFVNHQLQKAIDSILAESDISPIIILQSDHGSGLFTDLASSENTCIRERFSPFAAYYFPDVQPDVVPRHLSTVNLFRIVFNEYFDARLPMLDDKLYFYSNTQTYYDFEEVTARRDEPCG